MRARSDGQPTGLKVQAVYSIAALARIANVTTDLLRRLLRTNGVTFLRSGRAIFVPLSEIQRAIPPLWASLCAAEQARTARRTRPARPVVPGARRPQG
jgi:hypothetical protein